MTTKAVFPKFRVDKSGAAPRVFLQCSECSEDLRELKPHESVQVTRAYYCTKCEPGNVITINPQIPAYDAVIKQATIGAYYPEGPTVVCGQIYKDKKKRFIDGEHITTSPVIEGPDAHNIVRTKNSTYLIERADDDSEEG
jgi:hypothetical protein